MRKKLSMKDYYVYLHYRGNNNNKFPFYVGIGSKSRSKRNEGRNAIWTKIYKKNGRVVKYFVEECSKEEAFVFERMLICQYGKICDGTGYLANITNGGESGLTKAVVCDGTVYSSLSSASSELGLSGPEAIFHRIKSPHYNYYYLGEESNYDPLVSKKCSNIVVIADGIEYESISSCAKKYNISTPGVRTRIESPRFDFKIKGTNGNYNPLLHTNGFAKAVYADGILFKSITDAANHFDKNLTYMFRLINSGNENFRYATIQEIYNSTSRKESN